MKKFNFRLQKLLQLRQYRKLEKQKALARAERLRRLEEAHLAGLHGRMSGELASLAEFSTGPLNVVRRIRSIYYQHRLSASIVTQQRAIAQAEEQEAERRNELLAADRAEKVFDKLKQRQRERYLQELERRDQKETDEVAGNVFMRQKRK